MQTRANFVISVTAAKTILRDHLGRTLIVCGLVITATWIILLGYVLTNLIAFFI